MYTVSYSKTNFLEFYKYLTVLTEHQVTKLRNIAIGLSGIEVFSQQEIQLLESKLMLEQTP
jgi:hypothetical protein